MNFCNDRTHTSSLTAFRSIYHANSAPAMVWIRPLSRFNQVEIGTRIS